MKELQWGIIGLGTIAHDFAQSFNQTTSILTACASRSLDKAKDFAQKYQLPKAYGTYEELLEDEEISIIYVAVPNRQHHQHILKALKAGKHVLCEKAITMNALELEEVIVLAEQNKLVLAEAMTIFNMPLYHEMHKLIDSGRLGTLKMIQAPFGSFKEPDPNNRFFNPELAGGALLDIGTYAVSFARWFLTEQPEVISSTMIPFSTGVDEQSVTILQNKKNELATVSLTFQAKMPKKGIVAFENGYFEIDNYPRADKAELFFNDGTRETIESGFTENAMNYEIENMVDVIHGKIPNKSLFFTKDVIAILDKIQKVWKTNK